MTRPNPTAAPSGPQPKGVLLSNDNTPPLGLLRMHEGMSFGAWARVRTVKYWQGIPAFDPPVRRRDYEALADMAERMVATRRRRFPELVENGTMDRDAANRELAMFEHMAQGWRFICCRCDTAPDPAALDAQTLQDALDESLRTIAAMATKKNDLSGELAEQAECVIALRWWAEPALRLRPKSEITTTAKEGELA